MLKPDHTRQRFLISTTSRLVGEYDAADLNISGAWQFEAPFERMLETPFSRSYFMVSTIVPEPKQGGLLVFPNLTIDLLLISLSVLYGKRFDYHGAVEMHGLFHVPVLASNEPTLHPKIGFNNHQMRSNFKIGLDLSNLEIMRPLFDVESRINSRVRNIFEAAGKFYLQALQRYGSHPESAYLDLITCGEILSNYYEYTDEELYDDDLRQRFETIASELEDGKAMVRYFKNRLYQVSRKFRLTLRNLLSKDFCQYNEVPEDWTSVGGLDWETLDKRINAAYQVRSSYVHTGQRFSQQVQEERFEWQVFPIRIDDELGKEEKKFLKALNDAPTFKGLERIMRYCLLRFLQTNGAITFPSEKTETETFVVSETPTEKST